MYLFYKKRINSIESKGLLSYDRHEVRVMTISFWQKKMNETFRDSEEKKLEEYKKQLKIYALKKVKKELEQISQSVEGIECYLSDNI